MPLKGTDTILANALISAAAGTDGNAEQAWTKVAKAIIDHITANAFVAGIAPPNGGPLIDGRIE